MILLLEAAGAAVTPKETVAGRLPAPELAQLRLAERRLRNIDVVVPDIGDFKDVR